MSGEGFRWVLGGAVYVGLFVLLVRRLAPTAALELRTRSARLATRAAAGLGTRSSRRADDGRASSWAVAIVVALLLAATFVFPAQVGTPLRYLIRFAF